MPGTVSGTDTEVVTRVTSARVDPMVYRLDEGK